MQSIEAGPSLAAGQRVAGMYSNRQTDMSSSVDPRLVWDRRYSKVREPSKPDFWLLEWTSLLSATEGRPILDLGCGIGLDTQFMLQNGYNVVSADFSGVALKTALCSGINGNFVQADLRSGLPFRSAGFRLILASLVLHYFTWKSTETVVREIHRCLDASGRLLCRLNSTEDVNFGAESNPEIESGLYLVNDVPKRFFDRDDVERIFSDGWGILHLEKKTTLRASLRKHLWEVLLEKDSAL